MTGPNIADMKTSLFLSVVVSIDFCTNNFWYWEGRWKANQTPQVTLTNLGPGTIRLPTKSFY